MDVMTAGGARGNHDSEIQRSHQRASMRSSELQNRFSTWNMAPNFHPQKMQGRFFDGRRVEASLYTGKQRFKRSGAHDDFEGEGDEAEKKRLDDFANWLMTEGE